LRRPGSELAEYAALLRPTGYGLKNLVQRLADVRPGADDRLNSDWTPAAGYCFAAADV